MADNKILFAGMVDTYSLMKDKGVKVVIVSEEHTKNPGMLSELGKMQHKPGLIYITEGAVSEDMKDEMDSQDVRDLMVKKPKTPSQKLRNALYIYWEMEVTTRTWDNFYNDEMDKIIKKYLEQLD